MKFSAIQQLLGDTFPRIKVGADESSTPKAILLSASELPEVMPFLHRDDRLYFDMLSNLTGLDNGAETHTMEVIYTLYSIPFDHHLTVKVMLDRECPELPSVSHIWQTANWHEREAYDLLGIRFDGHPDLRRILLPADWEGHPLRKDYRHQEKYHGITVAYDTAENTHSN